MKRIAPIPGWLALALMLASGSSALAQPAAVEALGEKTKESKPTNDSTSWNLSAGAVLTTGNTQSLQINAGTNLSLARGIHGFELDGQYVLAIGGDRFTTQTAHNLRGRARYDLFFTPNDAAFAAMALRLDRFAGLEPRIQGQIGYLRNLFKLNEGKHRLWLEVGYDLTYDRFDYGLLQLDPAIDPATLPRNQIVHAGRLYVGYDNHLTSTLTYRGGLEALVNVLALGDVRLNWDNALRAKINGNLQAELKHTLQLDTQPVQGARRLDTTTTISLIYTLLNEEKKEEKKP